MPWAIKWRSDNRLDGKCETLLGRYSGRNSGQCPDFMEGHIIMVFRTRQSARDYISINYGYIADRPDLKAEPHGWKVPVPVKVITGVTEIQ